ncbi:MAG: altronate dehydratase [Clostridia bacterium]|nr:altronate dehydratase [Clostridia bacterium]
MIINILDNVEVNLENGHKYATRDIVCGENIVKYGNPIGHATSDIKCGDHVHTHNMSTNLSSEIEYDFKGDFTSNVRTDSERTFLGYLRENGDVGIRNEVWIINTVGCVNKVAKRLADLTGAYHFEHPYGCSQLGDDHRATQRILAALVNHPNAAGVLVLGLGCENNNIDEFKTVIGEYNEKRVRFLNVQDVDDEIEIGVRIINELMEYRDSFTPTPVSISKLRIGLKCGGSDGFSGISANPLVGRFADRIIAEGGSCLLTEVPEMFGAEHLLMDRSASREVFEKNVNMINGFKKYFSSHNQPIYENPSPGNKAGGITTLEEKSLGCVQKGGSKAVVDVLEYGERVKKNGLSLINGPGNDMVAITNLAAAGAQLILFTTGRGTPLGGPVPTVKISTNSTLAEKKRAWIDFDSSPVLSGEDLDSKFFEYVIDVAEGRQTRNEENGYREIAIFKNGITL